ncbi:hypothetical protein QCA50_013632 [Cerrena zonata]|uniref:Uncharacterized protein n=1 Tax=Cerrena zonata TaxID=2478898 RepID=A0AAW0FQ18_9APHY
MASKVEGKTYHEHFPYILLSDNDNHPLEFKRSDHGIAMENVEYGENNGEFAFGGVVIPITSSFPEDFDKYLPTYLHDEFRAAFGPSGPNASTSLGTIISRAAKKVAQKCVDLFIK